MASVAYSAVVFESFVALSFVYHVCASRFEGPKKLSWILTTAASCAMTLASMPFLWDHVTTGTLQGLQPRATLAVPACRFFQGYLISDLLHGVVYYRSHLTLSTGWFHHTIYLLIVEIAIRRSWAHVFCLACLLELPTFILGISSLYPRLRSNILFAALFFTTRILYHAFLCLSFYAPDNRRNIAGGSYVPAAIFTLTFPMHVVWFIGCINGFRRRARLAGKQVPTSTSRVAPLVAAPTTTRLLLKSAWVPPSIRRPYHYYRVRLSQKRQVLKQTWMYRMMPGRDRVFEYLGIGQRLRNSHM